MPTFKQLMKLAQVTVNDKTSGKRAKEILEIVHKDQVLHGMDPQKAVRFLEDLGPTYVKIGQLASNRADILPKDYCEAFAELRSQCRSARLRHRYRVHRGRLRSSLEYRVRIDRREATGFCLDRTGAQGHALGWLGSGSEGSSPRDQGGDG